MLPRILKVRERHVYARIGLVRGVRGHPYKDGKVQIGRMANRAIPDQSAEASKMF
jgi:hypothetical protein